MQKMDFEVIGTHLSLLVETTMDMGGVFREITEKLQGFEERYSRFREGNWLHELNTSRGAILDAEGRKVLTFMLDLAKESGGYFDPTVGKRLTELGYGKKEYSTQGTVGGKGHGDYRDIEIEGDEVILHGDVMLEFGGVGKGYLIDVIYDILETRLLALVGDDGEKIRYMINFGGDLYGKGGWKVGLESPFEADEVIGVLSLDDDYLACSAGTKRKWGAHHHLIDPHTGESARDVVASYVEGRSGMMTDAYATTLCVMPWIRACETLEKTPEISGVIVRHDGVVYQKRDSRAEIF